MAPHTHQQAIEGEQVEEEEEEEAAVATLRFGRVRRSVNGSR